jgi:hypothetical protein
MKVRTGFVSNSSSCSFIIQKTNLTQDQINFIKNFTKEIGNKYGGYNYSQNSYSVHNWSMYENDEVYSFLADRDEIMCDMDIMSFFKEKGIEVEDLDR